ncbi:hypothetical protein [Deinococcus hohokamensis]|uniref:Uncharacterized protein n=1 Tax=Deinococcus hohokamensis TaxID=309883 RepID=A0ABV9IBV1_9DEIO
MDFEAWKQADQSRMAEFAVELEALARAHGFQVEPNLRVVEADHAFPRLQVTFLQMETSAEQRERARAAQQIRALFRQ